MDLLYGTAWKEDDTARLVSLALEAGFRGIDTANQRKHYHEAQVGQALQAVRIPRDQLFIQTKFTFRAGQDERLPYDPKASITVQVEQSCQSSLEHLGLSTLDSYLLHGPSTGSGWRAADEEAWAAMEGLHASGRATALGVSNVSLDQLKTLFARAKVKPGFVQNRCYARTGWDADVRAFCRANHVRYQGFSLLTANPRVLESAEVRAMAKRTSRTAAQVLFRFACDVGMLPLSGTTDPAHLKEDLALDFTLTPAELTQLDRKW
ncbi:MAG: aldo/keto reductase [Archangium sp.]|nr:aldo/keto reductase [Archangium sp.]